MKGPTDDDRRDMDGKRRDEGRRRLTFVIGTSALCVFLWRILTILLSRVMDGFHSSVVSTFVAFMFVPLVLLSVTGRRIELGGLDRGLIISVVGYQVFAIWLVSYFWVNPDFFVDYQEVGEYALYLALVAFYVPSVDFFTRRIVHLEIERSFGTHMGSLLGTGAWVLGHSWEIIWLSRLTGPVSSFFFILVSGAITSILYQRYKNLMGLMAGHWMLNLIVTAVTSMLSN